MRLVISSPPKGRARTRTVRSASGSFKVRTRSRRRQEEKGDGGGGTPEPEARQIEGTESRVDGAPYAKKGRKRKKRREQGGAGWRGGVKSSVTALDESSYRLLRAAVKVKLTASEGWVFTGVARLPSCPPASLRKFFPRNIKFHGRGTTHPHPPPYPPPTAERRGPRAGGGVRSVCRRAASGTISFVRERLAPTRANSR